MQKNGLNLDGNQIFLPVTPIETLGIHKTRGGALQWVRVR